MPGETEALEALKAKINDRSCPTLDLARALETHRITYSHSHRSLADKLEMSDRRTYLSEVMGLLKLPASEQEKLKGQVLSWRTIRKLQTVDQPKNTVDRVDQGVDHPVDQDHNGEPDVDQTVDQSKTPVDHVDQGVDHPVDQAKNRVNRIKSAVDQPSQGYPLIRDTIDELVKLLTFWRQQLNLGQVVERWLIYFGQIGWLRATFRVLYFALAVYGTLQLSAVIARRAPWIPVWRWGSINKNPPASPFAKGGTEGGFGAPQITESRLIAGNRMRLRWNPVTGAATYRVYWNGQDGTVERLGEEVTTPGGVVSQQSINGHERGTLTVTALAANGSESIPSFPIEYDLQPINEGHLGEVKPLPPEGAVAQTPGNGQEATGTQHVATGTRHVATGAGSQLPVAAVRLAAPTDLHYELKTPDLIILSWRAVGPHINYNVYSSASQDLTNLRKENDRPMTYNSVHWTPETGLDRYWVVVTALDAQGHESNYSQAIEVIRHPEKSNAAMDAAAGTIRKVLPW